MLCGRFLPAACWKRTGGHYMFDIFICMWEILGKVDQRHADVGWDPEWMQPICDGARPDTWRHWLVDMVPSQLILKMSSKQIAKYSAAVGHSLEYELVF